jgi:hypothetical protein
MMAFALCRDATVCALSFWIAIISLFSDCMRWEDWGALQLAYIIAE